MSHINVTCQKNVSHTPAVFIVIKKLAINCYSIFVQFENIVPIFNQKC